MERTEWVRLIFEALALVFAAGMMRQQLSELNKTVIRIERDFTAGIRELRMDFTENVRDLTGRVNNHGERIGKLEGFHRDQEVRP